MGNRPTIGHLCRFYYSLSGDWDNPSWVPVPIATDVTVGDAKREADVTSRGSGGVARTMGGLRELSFSFDILWKSDHAALAALRTAYLNGTPIDVVALDGPITTPGSSGPRFIGEILQFGRNEPLSEGVKAPVVIKPTDSDDATSVAYLTVEEES